MVAQVARDRIIGLRREMRRQRRDPREKEGQDQRACHLAAREVRDAQIRQAPISRAFLPSAPLHGLSSVSIPSFATAAFFRPPCIRSGAGPLQVVVWPLSPFLGRTTTT